jgi:hypothetical protein
MMNGVIRFKGKATTVSPDNFSGVVMRSYRGGNRVTGSPMNSTVSPGVVNYLGYGLLVSAITFFVSSWLLYFNLGSLPFVAVACALGFLLGNFHFAIGEFMLSSELPRRGTSMLLIWGTVGLMFLGEVVKALIG